MNHCIIIAGTVNGCHEPQKFKIPGLIYSLIILQMYNIIQNRGCQPRRSKWNILARTNHDLYIYSGGLAGHPTIITHHNNIDYLNFCVFYNNYYDLCYNTVALFCLQYLSMFLIIIGVCVIGCKDARGPSECSRKCKQLACNTLCKAFDPVLLNIQKVSVFHSPVSLCSQSNTLKLSGRHYDHAYNSATH